MAVIQPEIAHARMVPVPKANETLIWSTSEWVDEEGAEAVTFSGPQIIATRQLSFDDRVALCYEGDPDGNQINDCLATFEEDEPSVWTEGKITEDGYLILDELAGEPTPVFLELTPINQQSSVDQFLETLYVEQELFDSGVLKKSEVLTEIIENTFAERRLRFLEIKEELSEIADITVLKHLEGLDYVLILMPIAALEEIEQLPWVDKIHVPDPWTESEECTVEPPAILDHMQLGDYYVHDDGGAGYDGEYDMPDQYWSSIVAAVLDGNGFNADHVAFNDNDLGTSRVKQSWTCNDGECLGILPPTVMEADLNANKPFHGTAVAGILAGDIRDGQDPYWTTTGQRIFHSGQAPEVELALIRFVKDGSGDMATMVAAIDRAVSSHVHLISISDGFNDSCNGTSSLASAANSSFKNGVLTVSGAGNTPEGECTVIAPADATGALTVGGIGDEAELTVSDWNEADIWSDTSHGPHNYKSFRSRSIIDLVAPACYNYFPHWTVNSGYLGYWYNGSDPRCGTSFAQPLVASALVDTLDHMLGVKDDSTFLLPGVQKVYMLQMGDRAIGEDDHMITGYDSSWGAGRTRVRRFDDVGMDAPWGRQNGYVCVGDGEEVIVEVKNGQLLSSSVDAVKASIWWYTDSFSNPVPNDIDLYLQRSANSINWTTFREDNGTDLKKRVYYSPMGGYYARLKIVGTQVNGGHYDRGSCPLGKARVYFIWIYEDNARDDYDGPGDEIGQL